MARVWMIWALLVCAGTLPAVPLDDSENRFRSEIPEGLRPVRVDPARDPDLVHLYTEEGRNGAILKFTLLPEPLKPYDGPPVLQPGARQLPVLWKGFTLYRVHRYALQGTTIVGVELSCDVPVERRGVRIALSGPVRREIEFVGMFDFVLEHFDARSNWLVKPQAGLPPPSTPSGADSPESDSDNSAAIGIAATIALVLGIVGGWWLRGMGQKPQPEPVEATVALTLSKPVPPAAPPKPVPELKPEPPPPPPKPAPKPARKPDETDPGIVITKCRVCGAELREGRKKCMNCGSEVY